MTTFGDRLRQLRRESGLSQAELASEGMSASYISLLEAGKRSPGSEVVNQLALRLGCSPSRLLDDHPSEREQRIELELAYARLAIEHGASSDARTRLERLLAEGGIPRRIADEIALQLAMACERVGDHAAAVHVAAPLFERAQAGDTHLAICVVAIVMCRCYLDSGDLNQAATLGGQALKAARAQGLGSTADYFRLAATTMHAYTSLGDFLHARTWADDLIHEAEAVGQHGGQAALYWNAAILAEHEGRISESLHLAQRALGHLSELDNTRDYARLRLAVAEILLACDPPRVEQASHALDRTLDDLRDLGSQVDLAEWNYVKSETLLHQGDVSDAEARARLALTLLDDKAPTERCHAMIALSDSLVAQRRDDEAAELRALAFSELERTAGNRASALQWRELAERMAELGDHVGAARAYRRALDGAGVRDRSRAARAVVRKLRDALANLPGI